MDFTVIDFEGGWGVDSPVSAYGLVADSREYGDEPSGSGATELNFNVSYMHILCTLLDDKQALFTNSKLTKTTICNIKMTVL
jgi:hypothetical protein